MRLNDGARPILAITSISPGSEGILWLCSFQCGLVRYNYASGETRLYNDNPVLVKSHVAECGADGRLWIGTWGKGLVRMENPYSDDAPDYWLWTTGDGLPDNRPSVFNRNAFSLTPDGRAVFGGTDGFTIFNPQQNAGKHEDTTPVITDLKLNNRSIRTLPEGERLRISEYDISSSDRIRLRHRQNSFALEFALLDFSNPGGQIFRYRLEGCDVDWTMADYNRRRASYNNLRSGRYRFRLQYSSGSGEWGLSERILDIRVKPSPWLSWWAWAGYFVLIALSAFYAACVWWRSNRKEEEPAGSNLVFSIDRIDPFGLHHRYPSPCCPPAS